MISVSLRLAVSVMVSIVLLSFLPSVAAPSCSARMSFRARPALSRRFLGEPSSLGGTFPGQTLVSHCRGNCYGHSPPRLGERRGLFLQPPRQPRHMDPAPPARA